MSPSEALMRMGTGYWVAKALYAAARLGVADRLAKGPQEIEDLAALCGADPEALYRTLRALASIGVFREEPGRKFALTPQAEPMRSDAPDSVRQFLMMVGEEQFDAWVDFLETVRTGRTAFDRLFGKSVFDYYERQPASAAVFHGAMEELTGLSVDALVDAYDFSGHRRVADVGGGHGRVLAKVLARHPHVEGVLFDRMPGIEAARKSLGELAHRCKLVVGDFFREAPEGADGYILKNILHDWHDDGCVSILSNIRRVMDPGGRVLVMENLIGEANAPSFAKWLDLHMLTVVKGRERTEGEYASLFEQAGLKLSRVLPTASPFAILEAVPA
ncbi:MAG: methyltransferase domain-containing protein [Myxococcales bacterium]|nr:methyltransferase domain-containing protein [Myxococcales bacterium]